MNAPDIRVVQCPVCSSTVEWSARSRWRPFCSQRCRLIDLGDWLDEAHRVPCEEPAGETPADEPRS